jgi:hypothetical protein
MISSLKRELTIFPGGDGGGDFGGDGGGDFGGGGDF